MSDTHISYTELYNFTKPTHYRLDDGRIWSIESAAFIESAPEDSVIVSAPGSDGKCDEAALKAALEFYGYNLGTYFKSIADVVEEFEVKVQKRLDGFARTLTYDSMLSACSYSTSTDPVFKMEGEYCVWARDITWAKAHELLNAFDPAVDAIPTWEEIEAQLPELQWPEGSRGYSS